MIPSAATAFPPCRPRERMSFTNNWRPKATASSSRGEGNSTHRPARPTMSTCYMPIRPSASNCCTRRCANAGNVEAENRVLQGQIELCNAEARCADRQGSRAGGRKSHMGRISPHRRAGPSCRPYGALNRALLPGADSINLFSKNALCRVGGARKSSLVRYANRLKPRSGVARG